MMSARISAHIRRLCVSSLLALGFTILTPAAHAQAVNAAASLSGALSAATLSVTLLPDNTFVNNGAKVWLALFDPNGQGYFYNPQSGWTPYSGGIAPAYGDVTSNRMSIAISQWNVSGSVGGQIYVAYGRSFEEMLQNNRFLQVHTIARPVERAYSENSALTCYNPYTYITIQYVGISFDLVNDTPYPISSIAMDVSLKSPSIAVPITGSFTYQIPGGLAAGDRTRLALEPNMFHSFSTSAKPFCGNAGNELSVKITSATDGTGQTHRY
jgi:hypothetical protein